MTIGLAEPDDPLFPWARVRPFVARREVPRLVRGLVYLWVSPTSAIGMPLVLVNQFTGGRCHLRNGVLEVHGRWVRRVLSLGPFPAAALTLGHVVLNVDDRARNLYREHELVHVCQAERWGPLFVPLYLALAIATWRRTGNGYWNHPWEVEARRKSGI